MDQSEVDQNMNAKVDVLVRKGGFEPPRLTAPPPQDGASASSATSARGKVRINPSPFCNAASAMRLLLFVLFRRRRWSRRRRSRRRRVRCCRDRRLGRWHWCRVYWECRNRRLARLGELLQHGTS